MPLPRQAGRAPAVAAPGHALASWPPGRPRSRLSRRQSFTYALASSRRSFSPQRQRPRAPSDPRRQRASLGKLSAQPAKGRQASPGPKPKPTLLASPRTRGGGSGCPTPPVSPRTLVLRNRQPDPSTRAARYARSAPSAPVPAGFSLRRTRKDSSARGHYGT
jgi:hypothetical protein